MPPVERIAVFDNDGTLWCEQPTFFQALFAFDRIRQLAPQHPEWKTREPFASVLRGDEKSALAGGMHAIVEMAMASHAGTTTEEFAAIVTDWIATARHPKTGKLYTEMVYQPMLELLAYLRANGFKTFIVSAGGIEFMRVFSERVYGVPPEQVIGTSIRTKFELRNGEPVLVRLPEMNFIDDGEGKPVGIQMHIGRRPLAAFGNADGDQQMLQWTAAGPGRRLMLLVDHTDAEREFLYRVSPMGRLELALDEAHQRGWTVVSMKNDWNRIFVFKKMLNPPTRQKPTNHRKEAAMQRTTSRRLWLKGSIACALAMLALGTGRAIAADASVTAIDILLEPDATMLQHAQALNDRLRKVYPKGFALDAKHRPHITLVQRFVLTENLDEVYAAVGKVFASANVTGLNLEAFKNYYIPDKDLGLFGIVIKPTPELLELEKQVIDAATPFAVKTGTSAAFVTGDVPEVLSGLDHLCFGVRAEVVGQELSIRTSPPASPQGISRPDARGTVRDVHFLAGRRGRLPPRPLRHGGEETQRMGFEALRCRGPQDLEARTLIENELDSQSSAQEATVTSPIGTPLIGIHGSYCFNQNGTFLRSARISLITLQSATWPSAESFAS